MKHRHQKQQQKDGYQRLLEMRGRQLQQDRNYGKLACPDIGGSGIATMTNAAVREMDKAKMPLEKRMEFWGRVLGGEAATQQAAPPAPALAPLDVNKLSVADHRRWLQAQGIDTSLLVG